MPMGMPPYSNDMPAVDDVRNYREAHSLPGYEIDAPGSRAFVDACDTLGTMVYFELTKP